MTRCPRAASDAVELYFYGELPAGERADVAAHLLTCPACRAALDDLRLIREALAARPVVDRPAGGDWSGFMTRLDASLQHAPAAAPARHGRGRLITYLAMAAVITLVTASVAFRTPRAAPDAGAAAIPRPIRSTDPGARSGVTPASLRQAPDPGLAALSEQHFERSKLVVLGLAAKDPGNPGVADWHFERELASSLLPDTRLYRRAAQDRGMTRLAAVMSDLEIVLLQASLSDDRDRATLPQIQRLIRKRDLVTKLEVVGEDTW